jgi:hypothetical protein
MLFNALMRGGITLFIVFYLATTLLWSISPRTHRDILSQLRQDYLREHKAGKDIDHQLHLLRQIRSKSLPRKLQSRSPRQQLNGPLKGLGVKKVSMPKFQVAKK